MKNNTAHRPTWVEIDLNALGYNFRQVKKAIPRKTKVLVCVKKDAYGHGLIPVARKLVSAGADYFGVASIDEGIILRMNNITKPVLVLGSVLCSDIDPIIKYDLTQTICSEELAVALDKKARSQRKIINIHIKVDTGMGRLGVLYCDALNFIKRIKALNHLNIEGVFTHLPVADSDPKFTRRQLDLLRGLKKNLQRENINIPLYHAANSMATIAYKESYFDLVRPGLIVYGLYPKSNLKLKLKPVMGLKTKITYLKKVPKNYGISYGRIYRTKKETTIAVLPVGYGDGYLRAFSNLASVLIKGKRFKISGRICMDQMMVDIGNLKADLGEEVVLIGAQGKREKITAEELSALVKTIPYEIACNIGNRLPRIYCV